MFLFVKEHRSAADKRLNVSDILPLVKVSRKLTNGFAFIVVILFIPLLLFAYR